MLRQGEAQHCRRLLSSPRRNRRRGHCAPDRRRMVCGAYGDFGRRRRRHKGDARHHERRTPRLNGLRKRRHRHNKRLQAHDIKPDAEHLGLERQVRDGAKERGDARPVRRRRKQPRKRRQLSWHRGVFRKNPEHRRLRRPAGSRRTECGRHRQQPRQHGRLHQHCRQPDIGRGRRECGRHRRRRQSMGRQHRHLRRHRLGARRAVWRRHRRWPQGQGEREHNRRHRVPGGGQRRERRRQWIQGPRHRRHPEHVRLGRDLRHGVREGLAEGRERIRQCRLPSDVRHRDCQPFGQEHCHRQG